LEAWDACRNAGVGCRWKVRRVRPKKAEPDFGGEIKKAGETRRGGKKKKIAPDYGAEKIWR